MRRVVLLSIAVVACQGPRAPIAPPPEEIQLVAARDRDDVATMRAHAWRVWRDLQGKWEHWPTSDAVIGLRERHVRGLLPVRVGDRVEAETLPLMFAVVFDPVAADHVARHRIGLRATLGTLTTIPDFPHDAITLKPVWFAIHRDRTTELPVWDGEPTRPDEDGNPSRTWRRRVVIDPAIVDTADHNAASLADLTPDRVPIGAFLYRAIASEREAAAVREVSHDATFTVGDYLVLIGMHVSTKEIPDWVWATFWWHDRPDAGRYAADRPRSLAGPAASYLMDVAYSADTPREPDGTPHVAMNPWLEARFPGGLHSNCVACHQRAAYGATEYLPVTRGLTDPRDPYFARKATTDFVWSLALEAR